MTVSVWDVSCPYCLVKAGEPCVNGYWVDAAGQLGPYNCGIHEERKRKAELESNDLVE